MLMILRVVLASLVFILAGPTFGFGQDRAKPITARKAEKKRYRARYPDPVQEGLVPTFPEGPPAAQHPEARWGLADCLFERTKKRYRFNLEGLWRFGPVMAANQRPRRNAMGWIALPRLWDHPSAIVYNADHRIAEGRWMGVPLERIRAAWLERELPTPAAWISRMIFLTIREPLRDAKLYVNGEPVSPTKKTEDAVVYELTSYLVYPGASLLDLYVERQPEEEEASSGIPVEIPLESAPPSKPEPTITETRPTIYVDVIPAGPHLQSVALVPPDQQGNWALLVRLGFPPIFPFPVRKDDPVPAFRVQVVDGKTGEELAAHHLAVRKRPAKPYRFPLELPEGVQSITVRLYEFVDRKPVLRDEFYPISTSTGKP